MTVATSPPPAGWYVDPDGSGGQRYWDGERWTTRRRPDPSAPRSALAVLADRVRRLWFQTPVVLRLALPSALVLILVGAGFYAWSRPLQEDDLSRLPSRLSCRIQNGPRLPTTITMASVAVSHPRNDVLAMMVRLAGPLPPPPTGSAATGFVGFRLTYSIANNGKKFVELGPQDGTDDLAIRSVAAGNRTAADTVEIYLELTRLKVDHQLIIPEAHGRRSVQHAVDRDHAIRDANLPWVTKPIVPSAILIVDAPACVDVIGAKVATQSGIGIVDVARAPDAGREAGGIPGDPRGLAGRSGVQPACLAT